MVVFVKHLWVSGITIYPFIFIKKSDRNPVLINHEKIHLKQQKEMLFVLAYAWYILEFLIRLVQYRNVVEAYHNISFEREAFLNQHNITYPGLRKPYSFLKYLIDRDLNQK